MFMFPDTHRYDDIIGLSRPVSGKHPPMPAGDRAAQFSPFAALTGYDAVVAEEARLTQRRIDLDEGEQALLDQRLREAVLDGKEHHFTWFVPDPEKAGGAYVSRVGRIRHLDSAAGEAELADRTRIPIAELVAICPAAGL